MLKTNGATKPHAAMAAATGPDTGTSSKCNYPYQLCIRIPIAAYRCLEDSEPTELTFACA
jgi:hypothetical protein